MDTRALARHSIRATAATFLTVEVGRLARHAGALEGHSGSLLDHSVVALAMLGITVLCSALLFCWFGPVLWLCERIERKSDRTAAILLGLLNGSVPACLLGAVVVVPSRYWPAYQLYWYGGLLSALVAGPLLGLAWSRVRRRFPDGMGLWLWVGMIPISVGWYWGTGLFLGTYGRIHVLCVVLILMIALGLSAMSGQPKRGRTSALMAVAVSLLGIGCLVSEPTPTSLALFYEATPHRWFAGAVSQFAIDMDGDGATASVGFMVGSDCDDFDEARRPGQVDLPGNGVDENCFGGDLSLNDTLFAATDLAVEPGRPPLNVLFIVVDGLRYVRGSEDGLDREWTPHLGALADRSLRFSDFRTCSPTTRLSVPDFLGGSTLGPEVDAAHPPAIHGFTLAGYDSAFISNETVYLLAGTLGRGFVSTHLTPGIIDFHEDRFIKERLSALLATHRDVPFFFYAHYLHGHLPYRVPDRCGNELSQTDRYHCAVSYVDELIQETILELDAAGLRDSTVIVVTADHGELLGEHGLYAHSNSVYDEVLHVPLIVSYPGVEATISDRTANCFDIMPTIATLAAAPINSHLMGSDLTGPPSAGAFQFARMREI